MSGEAMIPPSPEVIQEDIERRLDEDGVPHSEQGPHIRSFVRVVSEEIAALWQRMSR